MPSKGPQLSFDDIKPNPIEESTASIKIALSHVVIHENIRIVVDGIIYPLSITIRMLANEYTGKNKPRKTRITKEIESEIRPQIVALGGNPDAYGFRGNISNMIEKTIEEQQRREREVRANINRIKRKSKAYTRPPVPTPNTVRGGISVVVNGIAHPVAVFLRFSQQEMEHKRRINTRRIIADIEKDLAPVYVSLGGNPDIKGFKSNVASEVKLLLRRIAKGNRPAHVRGWCLKAKSKAAKDDFEQFLLEACLLYPKMNFTDIKRDQKKSLASHLYVAYQSWCGKLGKKHIGAKQFGVNLASKELGLTRKHSKLGNVWYGIVLRPSF